MAFFTDEERKKIEEEAEIRARVYLKYEKKSSGAAGVLSSVCPGLGQAYNGQMGKASLCIFIVLISLLILSFGILFQIKGMPTKEEPVAIETQEPVEMDEEGIVITEEEESAGEQEAATEEKSEKKSAAPAVLIIIGALGTLCGWNYSVKDAIRTAKRINGSY
ncbi:MAG: hypothetical protein JW957_00135 [Candidatus Omnitrophica bacterium]|nr:hypothetical protein [Candidatus Omnitrophota bacterium]